MVMNKNKHIPQAAETNLQTLRELFKPHLRLNKARLTCFLLLVVGVIAERTVSLVWLSLHSESTAKPDSIYRRFQRFFASCSLRPEDVGRLVLSLFPAPAEGWILAMDRTNWQFGKTHVNILAVTAIVGNVGLPVAWLVLPKKTKRGNSNKAHRVAVMRQVLDVLPAESIRVLTMDREFVGKSWLTTLRLWEVPYIVRVKHNTLVGGRPASWMCARNRWRKLAAQRHEVFDQEVHFAAKRINNGRDEYLAVIASGFSGDEALRLYRFRWGIETLFSHLKKRGFQFEDTHMTKKGRIEKLMGVLAVAFALCYRRGERIEEEAGTKFKKHGYRAKSIFRKGMESLHRIVRRPARFAEDLAEFIDAVLRQPLTRNFVV